MYQKSNVFTPNNIAELMCSFLKKHGNLLDPAVGNGALLKHTKLFPIDAYDINMKILIWPYFRKVIDTLECPTLHVRC